MTVTVTLQDGATDKYMRFGDEYVKHNDARSTSSAMAPNGHITTRRARGPT
jgi:hypothetical protein